MNSHSVHVSLPAALGAGLLALGPAVLAQPAHAASPEITAKSCAAQGGTFDRVQGVKSCTVTETDTVTAGPFSASTSGAIIVYTATWWTSEVTETTTTQYQKGGGDMTTEQSQVVTTGVDLASRECWENFWGTVKMVPVSTCESYSLYPAS
jgi:hypothetical protein